MLQGEDKKYVWWGLLGIGVAAFFYFLSQQNQSGQTNTVTVPYLVPQTTTGASPTASTSLSNQPNIIGNSPNSTIPNGANPLNTAEPYEVPGQYGFMPNLQATPPGGVANQITYGSYGTPGTEQSISVPGVSGTQQFYGSQPFMPAGAPA